VNSLLAKQGTLPPDGTEVTMKGVAPVIAGRLRVDDRRVPSGIVFGARILAPQMA
jgi:hypothetical protein